MTAIKSTRQIFLGSIPIGGNAPILVQSMTNTDTRDWEATSAQIQRLYRAGCEAVRIAVPDEAAMRAVRLIVDHSPIPVIADIHFDWRLAVGALENGVSGLRINPGNIGSAEKVKRIIAAAKACRAIMRIGVNSGSVQKDILAKYGKSCPQALVDSALEYAAILENYGFYDFKLSLKSSSVPDTIAAYRMISDKTDYPLHLGVTEAGLLRTGAIKSAVALGILLNEGIGDTIRVSLTADPEEEVKAAWDILAALGLRRRGAEIISCPTCGRTEIDIFGLAAEVEKALTGVDLPITVAVMGCVVNGPGEAKNADLGIAGGRDKGIIFRKGKIIAAVSGREALFQGFLTELENVISEYRSKFRD